MRDTFDFHHLCRLAQLDISETEKMELEPQLRRIVEWVDKLNEFKARTGDKENDVESDSPFPLRRDNPQPGFSPADVLANAPDKKDGFFCVPKVIKTE